MMTESQRKLAAIVADSTKTWQREVGASEEEILDLVNNVRVQLPDDYIEFLRLSNGGSGPLAISPLWFVVWPARDVVQSNKDCERDKYYPDLWLFGMCDGNLFAFDLRSKFPWPLIALDYLDSKRECVDHLGDSFVELASQMGRKE